MRSDPETLTDVLKILDKRLNLENPEKAREIRDSLADLGQLRSNDDIGRFSGLLSLQDWQKCPPV